MYVLLRRALLALLLLPLCGCATDSGPWVELKGRRFTVEVAADEESRSRGLMFRTSMEQDSGMLFIFEREQPLAFWMRNTRIPLDILYFDSEFRLVSAARGVPCTTPQCPTYPSEGPARYTLELNAGLARSMGLAKGDEMQVDPDVLTQYKLD